MFGDSEANRAILATVFVTIVIFSYTGSDLILNQREVVQYAQTEKEWVISFENSIVDDDEDNMTFTFNDIWAHQDEKVIDFFLDDVQVSEGFAIGFIDVKIIPEECNGAAESEGRCENGIWISDGGEWECDSISATLMGDNSTLTGQWYDSGNSLSKSDSGCEPLYLRIVIYPEYDEHNEVNQSAVNEYQALSPWKVGGWGQGVVSVQINVDVNSYGGFGPLDDSEELTIEVRVHEFRATATLNNMSL
ncbi:MAG: hypothetical protein CMB67_04690 [Euryarchaeota archaeon]|nr:hypothetical protein [Euryarchaeota archaeon]